MTIGDIENEMAFTALCLQHAQQELLCIHKKLTEPGILSSKKGLTTLALQSNQLESYLRAAHLRADSLRGFLWAEMRRRQQKRKSK